MNEYSLRTLIVEHGTEESNNIINIMNSSKLPYELIKLSHEETEKRVKEEHRKIPILLTEVGIFHNLYLIEWYVKVYGINGHLYDKENAQKPVLGLANEHFLQVLPPEHLFDVNKS